MDEGDRKLLNWFNDGHSVLSEYDDQQTWKRAFAMRDLGLLEARGLYTGCAKFSVTDAGRAALQITFEGPPAKCSAVHQDRMTLDQARARGLFDEEK